MPDNEADEKLTETIFDDEQESDRKETEEVAVETGTSQLWWKVGIVVLLVAAVAGIVASKQKNNTAKTPQSGGVGATVAAAGDDGEEKETSFPPDTVVATVNGESITVQDLDDMLADLPQQYQGAFKNNKQQLLEQVITRELLLQKARSSTEGEREQVQDDEQTGAQDTSGDDKLIQSFLEEQVLNDIKVTDTEIKDFYERKKDQMPAEQSYEELKNSLRSYALQEKQREAVNAYVEKLKKTANITRNQEWIAAQKAKAADNPLDRALNKDMPVVADFGRKNCVPCKMMKPILEKLKKEYKGRAEVLIIQTDKHPAVTQRVGVRAIPTQIFYDAEGNEVHRHQGFMSRDAIVKKLKDMGVK